jgi:thiopurine S-methyltransferase
MGFRNVYVADISEIPLQNLKNRVPEFPDDNLLHGDFFDLEGPYDIILEQTFFCARHPSLREKYAQKMAELLGPAGELAGLLFDAPMNEDRPPFGGCRAEYLEILGKYLNVLHMEACNRSIKPREGKEVFFRAVKH